MRWEQAEELRADPAAGPSGRKSAPGRKRSFWPALVVTGAAVAFGGVLWYAYQDGRSVSASGEPPLVKADEGPVKVKPDQPGGQDIPFQDSTVYDRLGQNGNGKQPPMEKLLPPPETPVQLPPPAPAPQPASQGAPAASAPANADSATLAPKLEGPPIVVTTGVQPAPQQPPQAAQTQPSAPPPAAAAQPDPIGALAAAALAKPEAGNKPAPAANAALSGSYRIQLSAVRTQDAVGPEWARLKHHFPDTLSSLKMEAAKTEVQGKGTFFRIEAGPLDQNGAKAACEHLRAQGLGCFVIKPSS